MLDQHQLRQLYQSLGLSETAQAVIDSIRASPPARRVQSGRGNVCVRYASRKMGVVIQAESHKNELAGIYEKEHDPDTLEYYDQPGQIELVYQSKTGRQVKVRHTPDFFVLRTNGIGWEEWKMEAELQRLTEIMPQRYTRDETGRWRCPPGEAYAQPLGFFYRVCSSAEIDWVFQRNLRFLEDYLRDDCPEVSPDIATEIASWVQARSGLSLDDLLSGVGETHSDSLYRLIASGQIYCDIRAAPLAEPKRVSVFPNQAAAQAFLLASETRPAAWQLSPGSVSVMVGAALLWDNQSWLIANLGEAQTWLRAQDGTLLKLPNAAFENLVKRGDITAGASDPDTQLSQAAHDILSQASPSDLQEANRRYQIIAPVLSGQPPASEATSTRTRRYWLARYRQAEQAWGCGYVGLIPRRAERGNRQSKLSPETQALMDHFIETSYETLKQKSKRAVFGELIRACEAEGIAAPSYPTFCQRVNQRPRFEQVTQRQGKRAAYVYEPFYLELEQTTPRHGDRPFEIVHIDHTQLDIELICSRTYRNLGRPWATFLMDAFSRRLLATYLTFDPPSYRSCMMVMRECVRRHGRFPQTLVVDGGSDFESIYFETLLARYECTKKTRPGAKPRFGSVCERLFGTANTTFIHNLLGHTQMTRHLRQVTKSVNPRHHAQWTMEALYVRLCEWGYEVYDTIDHPALGQSPRACFTQGLSQSGPRAHRLIAFDQDFQIFTLPTTPKGTAMVQINRGIKVNHIYYWADAFRDPQVERMQVPVRYDPFDAGIAYAFAEGRWVQCISEFYSVLRGRSERELAMASAELRQRDRDHGRRFNLTARRLAAFLESVEAEELLLQQRLQDAAAQAVRAIDQNASGPDDGSSGAPGGNSIQDTPAIGTLPSDEANTHELTLYGDF
jgi:putative transposase